MIFIKKYFEYIFILGICLLSFYYTDKVGLYVKSKNPLMKQINEAKEYLNVSSIDSVIIDELYIIPGLKGKEINSNKSFSKMQEQKVFNENILVFDEIKPSLSLEDNKNKIIIRGNKEKNSVSLIFEKVNDLTKYLNKNNYKVNILLYKEDYDLNYEMINNANIEKIYNNIEYYLKKNKINKNLCLINSSSIPDKCKGKYIIKPSLIINHSNICTEKNKIESGEIIFINNSLSISELNVLLNQIKYKDLKIVPLSELIKE